MFVSFSRFKPASGRIVSAWIVFALALCTCLSGCVQRRMTIRSSPPGALVYVDDYEIGTTPVSHGFTYYGKRKIRLVKDGYQTLTVMQSIPAPWYQIPPLDFVTENLVPGEIRDQQTFHYQLTPQMVVPTEQLLGRAEQLRRGIQPVGVTGPSSPAPTVRVNPAGPEIIPPPQGVGGQTVYPLPPTIWSPGRAAQRRGR